MSQRPLCGSEETVTCSDITDASNTTSARECTRNLLALAPLEEMSRTPDQAVLLQSVTEKNAGSTPGCGNAF